MSVGWQDHRPRRRQPGFVAGLLVGVVVGAAGMWFAMRVNWANFGLPFGTDRNQRQQMAISEISQLNSAIGLFRTKFNTSHVPAFGGGPNGAFRLCTSYTDPTTGSWLPWPEVVYLKSVFPQMNSFDNGARVDGKLVPATEPLHLDPNQTLVFFLTGGPYMNYQGFSHNKQQPFAPGAAGEQRLGPFLDLPANKYDAQGHLLDPYGTPYAYFSFDPAINAYPTLAWPDEMTPYQVGGKYLHPKGFQIISAGKNQQFGPGGRWTPGQGPWVPDGPGGDDLANFNAGTLSTRQE
jgi:hypothetical protein